MPVAQSIRVVDDMIVPELRPAQLLSVTVLGGLSLAAAGRPIQMPNRRARALLAYLAIESAGPAPRERLSGLFWAESSQAHAASSLRQTLFELRRTLRAFGCDVLVSGRDEVGLVHDRIELDLNRSLAAIAAGRVSDLVTGAAADAERMLAGYEDLSPAFRDWLAATRRSAQERLLAALERVWRDEAVAAATRRRFAEAALRLEPVHEAACREAMRLAAEAGEIGVALRLYEALFEAMGHLLDMEPSQATTALVAAIKLGALERAGPAPSSVAVQPSVGYPLQGLPVVAMLPLHVIGGDPRTAWTASALVEDSVRILAGLRELAVISANSTRHLTGGASDMAAVAQRLGADYIVSGSLRMVSDVGRLHIELCAPRTGAVLWADAHQFDAEAVFEAQERIAARIANALAPNVNAAEHVASLSHRPNDLGAYHLVLQARHLASQLDRVAFDRAGAMLVEAVGREPGYAGGHAALAAWYGLRFGQWWSPNDADDIARLMSSARTALRLDPQHARALALLGHHTMLAEERHDAAAQLLDRAVALAPNDAEVLLWSAPTTAYVGRTAEAIARARRALALSPDDPFRFRYAHFLSLAHYAAGDYQDAAAWGLQSWHLNPNYISNLRIASAALAALDRTAEARPIVERYRALAPGFRAAHIIAANSFRESRQRRLLADLLVKAGLPR